MTTPNQPKPTVVKSGLSRTRILFRRAPGTEVTLVGNPGEEKLWIGHPGNEIIAVSFEGNTVKISVDKKSQLVEVEPGKYELRKKP